MIGWGLWLTQGRVASYLVINWCKNLNFIKVSAVQTELLAKTEIVLFLFFFLGGGGYRIKYFNPSLVLERMFSSSASALFQWSLSRTYVKRWKGSGILHLPLQLDPVLIHLIDMAKTATFPCFILLDAFWERIYSGCQNFDFWESNYSGYHF